MVSVYRVLIIISTLLVILTSPGYGDFTDTNEIEQVGSGFTSQEDLYHITLPLSLPAIIKDPGVYRIENDYEGVSNESAIIIQSSDVIIEGAGHTLSGAVSSDPTAGILVYGDGSHLQNISLYNLTINGYQSGLNMSGVQSGSVDSCTFQANQYAGLEIRNSSDIVLSTVSSSENKPGSLNFGGFGIIIADSRALKISRSLCNYNGYDTSGSGIQIDRSDSIRIEDSTISGNADTGITAVSNVTNLELKDLIISSNKGNGLSLGYGSDRFQISGCRIESNGQTSLSITGSRGGILSGNEMRGSRIGFSLTESEEMNLHANIFQGNKINMDITGTTPDRYRHTIDRTNRAENREIWYLVDTQDISIGPSDNPACIYIVNGSGILISDLVLNKNGAGIFLVQSRDVTISQVVVLENAVGIRIDQQSRDIVLKRCSAEMNLVAGYSVNSGENISYVQCSAENNLAGFVASQSSHLRYEGSHANLHDGLQKRGPSGFIITGSDQVIIANSSASYNSFDGIYLKGSTNVSIEGTNMQGNKIAGLAILSDDVSIQNSTVSGNIAGGVLIYGNNTRMVDSYVYDNKGRGLIIDSSTGIEIWNNEFRNVKNAEISSGSQSLLWNTTPGEGRTVTGTSYLGGNYWGSPDKSGFSDRCVPDVYGFCTQTYQPGGYGTDYYPLAVVKSVGNDTHPVSSDGSGGIKGDINHNGRLDTDDVVSLMYLISDGNASLIAVYDFTGDDRINLQDVVALFELVSAG